MYNKNKNTNQDTEIVRVRLPRNGELLGLVVMLTGGSRLQVDCTDGKTRMCRIPGKFRRDIWVRANDYVIVKPWPIQADERGDIIWRYTKLQADWLKKKGHLKNL
ncbi:translation initiation factor eIF-1A [Candidatus Micrarchaeota archaeon]|nr:translation initiation factor eIF-1A [Candidatus Micrarchaeota archaeon]